MTDTQLNLLIVTEHHLLRESLAAALVSADSRFVVSFSDSAETALDDAAASAADVLLVDLNPPNRLTAQDMKQLAAGLSGTQILVVGQPKQEAEIVAFLEAGAADYRITQNKSVSDLSEAIWKVYCGEVTHART